MDEWKVTFFRAFNLFKYMSWYLHNISLSPLNYEVLSVCLCIWDLKKVYVKHIPRCYDYLYMFNNIHSNILGLAQNWYNAVVFTDFYLKGALKPSLQINIKDICSQQHLQRICWIVNLLLPSCT